MNKPTLEQENIVEAVKDEGYGNVLVNAYAGSGKCFKLGTKVMMFDGSTKNVEDVVVGDKVM